MLRRSPALLPGENNNAGFANVKQCARALGLHVRIRNSYPSPLKPYPLANNVHLAIMFAVRRIAVIVDARAVNAANQRLASCGFNYSRSTPSPSPPPYIAHTALPPIQPAIEIVTCTHFTDSLLRLRVTYLRRRYRMLAGLQVKRFLPEALFGCWGLRLMAYVSILMPMGYPPITESPTTLANSQLYR